MLLLIIAAFVVVVDQFTKYLVTSNMIEGMGIPIIDGIFHLTYILNPGAAFGILENNRWFFVLTAVAVLAILFFYRHTIMAESRLVQIGIALFAGGALGNLIDRIRTGLVIDFFDLRIWPIFNVADIAICLGVGLILWSTIKMELKRTN
ncbi:MAG: signal peptidase II [Acidaminococcaceae bacterium]